MIRENDIKLIKDHIKEAIKIIDTREYDDNDKDYECLRNALYDCLIMCY